MDTLDPRKRSEIMARVRSSDTKPEIALRKALWGRGYRYRKNVKKVPGKPDICFMGLKIAIFCDSEFWHGKYYLENRRIPKSNTNFWVSKFKRNIARDEEVNATLVSMGWIVLRFWEDDIKKNLNEVVKCVEEAIKKKKAFLFKEEF